MKNKKVKKDKFADIQKGGIVGYTAIVLAATSLAIFGSPAIATVSMYAFLTISTVMGSIYGVGAIILQLKNRNARKQLQKQISIEKIKDDTSEFGQNNKPKVKKSKSLVREKVVENKEIESESDTLEP